MREIKFRFWSDKAKAIISWEVAKKECDRLSLFTLDGFTPMQFTGLLDKNGKEIYEGDVFDCIYKSDGCKHQSVVVFEAPEFRLKYIGKCQQTGVYQRIADGARYGVIGNVHENPELTKGE